MPTGRYGHVTYVEKECPIAICKKIFTVKKGDRRKTCSKVCGQALRTMNIKKDHAKWSVNKVKEEKKKEIANSINERTLHLRTMFVGGYDGCDRDERFGTENFVICNEGEIL